MSKDGLIVYLRVYSNSNAISSSFPLLNISSDFYENLIANSNAEANSMLNPKHIHEIECEKVCPNKT